MAAPRELMTVSFVMVGDSPFERGPDWAQWRQLRPCMIPMVWVVSDPLQSADDPSLDPMEVSVR